MTIHISWKTPTVDVDEIRIYRSPDPISDDNLPTPLAVLAGDAVEYTDVTNLLGVVYWYRFAVVKDGSIALSMNKSYGELPNTGHGPQSIQRGDYNVGLFGVLSDDEFFSASELTTHVGFGTPRNNMTWFKAIHNGKIIFFPGYPVANLGFSWNQFYERGLVWGTEGPGPVSATTGEVDQNVTISKDGFIYRIKLMDAHTLPTGISQNNGNPEEGSFIDQCFARIFENTPNVFNDKLKWNSFIYSNNNGDNLNGDAFFNRASSGSNVARWAISATVSEVDAENQATSVFAFESNRTDNTYPATLSGHRWAPVLELVM